MLKKMFIDEDDYVDVHMKDDFMGCHYATTIKNNDSLELVVGIDSDEDGAIGYHISLPIKFLINNEGDVIRKKIRYEVSENSEDIIWMKDV